MNARPYPTSWCRWALPDHGTARQDLRALLISVFEVGPGSAIWEPCRQDRPRYLSYDVTQPLYLRQSRIRRLLAGWESSPELARRSTMRAEPATHRSRTGGRRSQHPPSRWRQGLTEGRVVHLPWWTYAKLLGVRTFASTRSLASNSNLGEILARGAAAHPADLASYAQRDRRSAYSAM